MVYNMDREKLNRMFGFEEREWFLAGCYNGCAYTDREVSPIEYELPYVEGSGTFEEKPTHRTGIQ